MRDATPFIRFGPGGLPRREGRALELQRRWDWAVLPALVGTIPAFYLELLDPAGSMPAMLLYGLAAAVLGAATWHTARHADEGPGSRGAVVLDAILAFALLLAVLLPPSALSNPALTMRLGAAGLTLLRLMGSLQPALRRGSLVWLLLLALTVLGLCGAGFWWLEPRALTLGDGLWLAFTTAATVGYGDIVPTTPASKIFAVFVVLLGFAVLSLVTAAIAAMWVETEERRIEHEILTDLHHQIRALRREVAGLRGERVPDERGDPPRSAHGS